METIKDLIYFDYEKAKSLNSQLSGGLINEITRAVENESGTDAEIGFDIKILKGKTGENDKEKSVKTERIEIYHELLNDVEKKLSVNNTLKNLNIEIEKGSYNDFLERVPKFTYVKACGWSTFEDYNRFKRILANFNDIQRLVYGSALDNSPEIIALKKQINDAKKSLKQGNNTKELIKLKAVEKQFDLAIEKESDAQLLDETFVERVTTFLNTFNPNRLNFRLLPFDYFPEFQMIANLRSEFLINGDFENVIYTYGSRPNIKLTMFGIITSCPQLNDNRIDPMNEFIGLDESDLSVESSYDKVFRNVFSTFEGLEKFFYPGHPKLSISPIGIYREIILEQ
ncbi:MAG: hypothetical protein JNM71_12375 [Flavobacterium lindanitolerans]|uniref:DUF6414 family protein n=1 Tax=Flavobacterium lindanitolerans TaxID=428988 RepID=UPI001A48DEFE|nr:hypothetical protein [Flavobacterium lindanitolerans]MBL7868801.1 hypothetical protein [Flavobacterium lindanitolerans]